MAKARSVWANRSTAPAVAALDSVAATFLLSMPAADIRQSFLAQAKASLVFSTRQWLPVQTNHAPVSWQ